MSTTLISNVDNMVSQGDPGSQRRRIPSPVPPKGPRNPLRSAHHGPKPPSPALFESVSDPLSQRQVAPGRGEAPRYRGGHVVPLLGGAKESPTKGPPCSLYPLY